MHNKIKYIIATTALISAVSGFLPANVFTLGSVKAYAVTDSSVKNGEISLLKLTWGNGNNIKLLQSYSGSEVNFLDKADYYVTLKGISNFNIAAEVKGSGYVVKVFTSSSKTEKGQAVGEEVNIDSAYDSVYLRTYKSEEAYKEAYEAGDVSDCEKTYVIHVKKTTGQSQIEQDREYAYLDGIYLSDGNINFSKDVTSYDVNVGEDVDKLTIRPNPEDDENYVEINGYAVTKDDDFQRTVDLDKGNNTIKVYVENDDEDTTYTLNVYRGKATASTSNTQNFTVQSEGNSLNAWQRVDGKWRYIDGTGSVLRNQWWFDKNTQKNYFLDEDGYRTTGWLKNNNSWYHFNDSGEMETGWINSGKNWYYLNKSGVMKMGWLEDSTGNWYYLDNSGAMKTGWVVGSDGKWYYLDSTGKLIKNSAVNGYVLGSDGALIN